MPAQSSGSSRHGTGSPAGGAPLCIEILGASVSAGFVDSPLAGGSRDNASTPLLVPLRRWLEPIEARVHSRADAFMFLDAASRAGFQVARAARATPDLVVAIDYLFWFGYGFVDLGNDADLERDELQARLARLRQGLKTIDALQCPIVLGDMPDMRGAERRMLRAGQIPSVDCLQAMNEEIAAWAKERPRVRLFPLSRLVAEMKEKGAMLPIGGGDLATSPGALLQSDRLHATRLGVAYLAYRLEPVVRAALPDKLRDELPAATFLDFCAHARAEVDLADLQHGARSESPDNKHATTGGR